MKITVDEMKLMMSLFTEMQFKVGFSRNMMMVEGIIKKLQEELKSIEPPKKEEDKEA